MKFCFIVSIPHLNDFACSSNYHLTLIHLFEKYLEYERFYERRAIAGDYVILDNSYFELGKSVSSQRLINVMKKIDFQEVVAPEVDNVYEYEVLLYDFKKRLDNISYKGKIQAVVKGDNLKKYLCCYDMLINHPHVDVIGIPVEMSKVCRRLDFFDILERKDILFVKEKHLLGLEFPEELKELKGVVRSCDSSIPFWHGVYGVKLYNHGFLHKKIKEKMDFEYEIKYKEQYRIIKQNIKVMKKLSK